MSAKKEPTCTRSSGEGHLPACALLANPYVPFQQHQPPKYDARKGLIRGTLFPGLDLPFMDMVNQDELPNAPLHELQALGFAIQELALYLDTHRDDQEAFELYKAYQELYDNGIKIYEESFGPLNHHTMTQSEKYRWLDTPWPWEYQEPKG